LEQGFFTQSHKVSQDFSRHLKSQASNQACWSSATALVIAPRAWRLKSIAMLLIPCGFAFEIASQPEEKALSCVLCGPYNAVNIDVAN
jgi:hypothetical protein